MLGRNPEDIRPEDYLRVADEIGWQPTVRSLDESAEGEPSE